ADRRDMLLEIEEALRLPVAGLLDRDADVDAILGVDERAYEECEHPENADGGGVAGCGYRAKARDEAARSGHLAHRHRDGHGLVRKRPDQGNREQQVDEQPGRPERIDRDESHDPPHLIMMARLFLIMVRFLSMTVFASYRDVHRRASFDAEQSPSEVLIRSNLTSSHVSGCQRSCGACREFYSAATSN